jgi:hypothetical protein
LSLLSFGFWHSQLKNSDYFNANFIRYGIRLSRLSSISITWQAESAGMRLLGFIPKAVKSMVDVFLKAYASANSDALRK